MCHRAGLANESKIYRLRFSPLSFNEGKCYNVRVFLAEHYIMVAKKHKGAVNAEKEKAVARKARAARSAHVMKPEYLAEIE